MAGSTGRSFLVLRPTLADVVLKMPRGAQVIYPKDLGAILMAADIAPGQRVLEAGVGSGACRWRCCGPAPRSSATRSARTSPPAPERTWPRCSGPTPTTGSSIRDVTEGIDETGLDRVVLDLPEPWRVLPHAATALRPGGILLAYLPTINQTAQLREAPSSMARSALAETVEILRRTWHVEARSVRPDHRMVGHTGFLTTARRRWPAASSAGRTRRTPEDARPSAGRSEPSTHGQGATGRSSAQRERARRARLGAVEGGS